MIWWGKKYIDSIRGPHFPASHVSWSRSVIFNSTVPVVVWTACDFMEWVGIQHPGASMVENTFESMKVIYIFGKTNIANGKNGPWMKMFFLPYNGNFPLPAMLVLPEATYLWGQHESTALIIPKKMLQKNKQVMRFPPWNEQFAPENWWLGDDPASFWGV